MSSRDTRRRERSWERSPRQRDEGYRSRGGRGGGGGRGDGRRRPSRSRSPPRRGDRDDRRGGYDRRDYPPRDRDSDRRRDRDDDRGGRERERYDDRRDRDAPRRRDDDRDRQRDDKGGPSRREGGGSSRREELSRATSEHSDTPVQRQDTPSTAAADIKAKLPDGEQGEGEAMDEVDPDEEAMMAAMGMASFGSSKGKHVQGNQDGGVDIKKVRTWRQYMNRRGGFNRPLDKIK